MNLTEKTNYNIQQPTMKGAFLRFFFEILFANMFCVTKNTIGATVPLWVARRPGAESTPWDGKAAILHFYF